MYRSLLTSRCKHYLHRTHSYTVRPVHCHLDYANTHPTYVRFSLVKLNTSNINLIKFMSTERSKQKRCKIILHNQQAKRCSTLKHFHIILEQINTPYKLYIVKGTNIFAL